MALLKKWFSLPEEPEVTTRQNTLGSLKSYLLVRWKKRWPIAALAPFFVASWAMTAETSKVHQQLQRTVIGAIIFVAVVIVFPFRWGGEDWKEPKTGSSQQ